MKQLYVADTVAIVHYLTGTLPKKADEVFRQAEDGKAAIIVPSIAIAELAYIVLKGRVKLPQAAGNIRETIRYLYSSEYMKIIDLPYDGWDAFFELQVPELHDRMIAAIARSKNVPVITNDSEIIKSQVETLW